MIPRILALPLPAVPCLACEACALFADTGEVFAQPGDVAMCARCGTVQILTDVMSVRDLEPEDLDALDPDDLARFYAVMNLIRTARAQCN